MTRHATSTEPTMTPPAPPAESRQTAQVFDLEVRRLQAALRGDDGAFTDLVRPHLPLLFRVAARAGRDAQLAEDAVQEGLEIAARRLAEYEPGTSLRAWLASIVSKRAFTLSRSEWRRRSREDASAAPERSADPQAHLEASQLAGRLQAALEALPDKRRQAVALRLDGALSYEEIALAIGSTPASARVLVHLGLKALKDALQDDIASAAREVMP